MGCCCAWVSGMVRLGWGKGDDRVRGMDGPGEGSRGGDDEAAVAGLETVLVDIQKRDRGCVLCMLLVVRWRRR